MTKLYIKEDITDWRDEALRNETIFTDRHDIIDALDDGQNTNQIGRAAMVSRALGEAPDDILRPNKFLLNAAATQDVIAIARHEKVIYETDEGKKIRVNAFVGSVKMKDEEGEEIETDSGPSFVRSDDRLATERAEAYLLNVVPGHVRN